MRPVDLGTEDAMDGQLGASGSDDAAENEHSEEEPHERPLDDGEFQSGQNHAESGGGSVVHAMPISCRPSAVKVGVVSGTARTHPAAPARWEFSRCENSARAAAGRRKVRNFQHSGTFRRSVRRDTFDFGVGGFAYQPNRGPLFRPTLSVGRTCRTLQPTFVEVPDIRRHIKTTETR
jgi:hypothetical protein